MPTTGGVQDAPGRSFYFRKRSARLDWRLIASLDVDRVARDVDYNTLQECLENITFANIDLEDTRYVDANFIKLLKLCQLSIEYALQGQEYLASQKETLERQVAQLVQETDFLKRERDTQNVELKNLRKETKHQTKLIAAYQQLAQAPASSGMLASVHACQHCSKSFSSNIFLESHMQRRHPEVAGKPAPIPTPLIGSPVRAVQATADTLESVESWKRRMQASEESHDETRRRMRTMEMEFDKQRAEWRQELRQLHDEMANMESRKAAPTRSEGRRESPHGRVIEFGQLRDAEEPEQVTSSSTILQQRQMEELLQMKMAEMSREFARRQEEDATRIRSSVRELTEQNANLRKQLDSLENSVSTQKVERVDGATPTPAHSITTTNVVAPARPDDGGARVRVVDAGQPKVSAAVVPQPEAVQPTPNQTSAVSKPAAESTAKRAEQNPTAAGRPAPSPMVSASSGGPVAPGTTPVVSDIPSKKASATPSPAISSAAATPQSQKENEAKFLQDHRLVQKSVKLTSGTQRTIVTPVSTPDPSRVSPIFDVTPPRSEASDNEDHPTTPRSRPPAGRVASSTVKPPRVDDPDVSGVVHDVSRFSNLEPTYELPIQHLILSRYDHSQNECYEMERRIDDDVDHSLSIHGIDRDQKRLPDAKHKEIKQKLDKSRSSASAKEQVLVEQELQRLIGQVRHDRSTAPVAVAVVPAAPMSPPSPRVAPTPPRAVVEPSAMPGPASQPVRKSEAESPAVSKANLSVSEEPIGVTSFEVTPPPQSKSMQDEDLEVEPIYVAPAKEAPVVPVSGASGGYKPVVAPSDESKYQAQTALAAALKGSAGTSGSFHKAPAPDVASWDPDDDDDLVEIPVTKASADPVVIGLPSRGSQGLSAAVPGTTETSTSIFGPPSDVGGKKYDAIFSKPAATTSTYKPAPTVVKPTATKDMIDELLADEF